MASSATNEKGRARGRRAWLIASQPITGPEDELEAEKTGKERTCEGCREFEPNGAAEELNAELQGVN